MVRPGGTRSAKGGREPFFYTEETLILAQYSDCNWLLPGYRLASDNGYLSKSPQTVFAVHVALKHWEVV